MTSKFKNDVTAHKEYVKYTPILETRLSCNLANL